MSVFGAPLLQLVPTVTIQVVEPEPAGKVIPMFVDDVRAGRNAIDEARAVILREISYHEREIKRLKIIVTDLEQC